METSLKEIRKRNNFTQKEMAKVLGVSLSMYEKVERGYIRASRNFIEKTIERYPEINVRRIFFSE